MNKKIITITLSVLALILVLGGATYAFYEWVGGTYTNISFDGLFVKWCG